MPAPRDFRDEDDKGSSHAQSDVLCLASDSSRIKLDQRGHFWVAMIEPVVPPARQSLATVVVALLLLSLLIALFRLHTYNEPLDRDLAAYAVIAHEMLAGRPLYADLWDHKPPAIHVTFALGEWLCGYGPQSIYFLNVAAAILTLLGVYAAGAVYPGERKAGLWRLRFVHGVLISNNLTLQANCYRTGAGAFSSTPQHKGFRPPHVQGHPGCFPAPGSRAALIALLFALASCTKQVEFLPIAPLLGCTHASFSLPERFPRDGGHLFRRQ